jgi:hypothetical protein
MNRSNILRISTIAALGVALMTSATVGKSDKERFIGTWTLVSITSGEGANQTLPYGYDPNEKGTMTADANGRFSSTVVHSNLSKAIAYFGTYSIDGTTFGTYSIDEATHVLTLNVENSKIGCIVGRSTQTRILSFGDDEVMTMMFNPTRSMGGSRKVTYRRAKWTASRTLSGNAD